MSVDTISHSLAHTTLSDAKGPSFASCATSHEKSLFMQAYDEACKKALDEFDEEKRLDLEEVLEMLKEYADLKERERTKQVIEEQIAEDKAELVESLEQNRLHILRTGGFPYFVQLKINL
ncbi:hypothetical protein L198_07358 [Cryptococcus wingfieldii CBS 7118]|uniref:Uncharacterized protein n=1 Tax=Cryptococcus wingfieldii CBS 7118 TaxID=1295528 RepID=A0A1E3ICM7_9TREE|nr:hypothetical protein L198_07358 [Cryptococcus wingfieldii CBS 7118]ODN86339.1 hypothetical protein L198_07358 [Cryptococcus wingfieldii CBS 7118]